jgi:hypothetical protein
MSTYFYYFAPLDDALWVVTGASGKSGRSGKTLLEALLKVTARYATCPAF